ncbi:MAG: aminopeptidase P N-terminal domain-containing protein [Gemmatimonadota bacterium]
MSGRKPEEGRSPGRFGGASIPSPRYAERRKRVLEELGADAMVLPGAPVLHRSRDSELPYRPDSELHYLTGFSEPGALLVLRGFADERRSLLFTLPHDPEAELWTGPRLGPEGAAESLGLDAGLSNEQLSVELPGLLEGARRVHFRLGAHPAVEPLIVRALRTARVRGARTGTGPRAVVDPGEILDEFRLRKDEHELALLRQAAAVSVQGFREGIAAVAPGRGEWEVQAALEGSFLRQGASGPGFATIVGAGANACTLHYVANADRIAAGELVLIDGGAEVGMYGGDITRTVPSDGTFGLDHRAVYEVVEAARAAAVATVRPGASIADVHGAAVKVIVAGLVEFGILSGAVDELVEEEAHKHYFPHRTSHWLGMDTHDPGDYSRGGSSRTLEPGMVLTVEPGLYFPRGSEHFPGIGVRIEDDVLVTAEGAEVLTADLPTAPDEIADLVGG